MCSDASHAADVSSTTRTASGTFEGVEGQRVGSGQAWFKRRSGWGVGVGGGFNHDDDDDDDAERHRSSKACLGGKRTNLQTPQTCQHLPPLPLDLRQT